MDAVDLSTFLRQRRQHLTHVPATNDTVEIGAARMHYESQDSWTGTVSCCRDWRVQIRMSAIDARADAPDIVVGTVDFLILRLGLEPVADALELFGEQAAAFTELFDDEWLAPDIDEHDDFTAGMPIGTALLILDATVDDRLPADLRPWAVIGRRPHDAAHHIRTRGHDVHAAHHLAPGVGGPPRPRLAARRMRTGTRSSPVPRARHRIHIPRRRAGSAGSGARAHVPHRNPLGRPGRPVPAPAKRVTSIRAHHEDDARGARPRVRPDAGHLGHAAGR